MQEFNKVTTTSNFIKQLLNDTYLPVIRTVLPGDFIIANRLYILRCSIIKCNSSGYLLPYEDADLTPMAQFTTVGEYTFGEKNDRLCTNFQSSSEGYDSLTHERLGKYLRSLRDMYGLNLMPLYNCFSNNTLPNHHIFSDRIIKTSHNYNTKIYKVPIRFNTDYTVCIENLHETTIAPAFIRNNNLVKIGKNNAGDTTDITNDYVSVHTNDVISTYYGLRFYSPIKVRFNNIPETIVKRDNPLDNIVGYDIVPITIDNHVGSKYFNPIIYNDIDELIENINNTYQLDVNTNTLINFSNNIQNLETLTVNEIEKYIVNEVEHIQDVYFTCTVNPSKLGWKELSTITTPDSVTIEGDVFVTTTDTSINLDKQYYQVISKIKPTDTIYDITETHCNKYDSVEDTLYMLIQLPESFEGNIVILEGDYTHTDSVKIFNNNDLAKYPDNILDNLFINNLRLLRLNIKEFTPFSDTLMQFLLWHAICNLDTINLDMDRLHFTLKNLYMEPDETTYANYWYYKYRQIISEYVRDNGFKYIDDNLGYVTTEIESFLNGLKNGD